MKRTRPLAEQDTARPSVDAHAHIFCWGENPAEGFLSEKTRNSWLTRLLLRWTGVLREPGESIGDKMRNRLLRHLCESRLDRIVVLAQDAVYRDDGSRDDSATHTYVSNDYVFDLAKEDSRINPGCSVNPIRTDALEELARCHEAGARLVKVHTAIQGVDPALARFDPFYRLAAELGMVMMFHTGYEHACPIVSQEFTDPARLARPLDHGGAVIAAHSGTCAFFDREDYYPNFIDMLGRYENLYGDTSIMASLNRWFSLRRLGKEPDAVKARIIHGSDYPFPPARPPYLFRIGLFHPDRRNPFDMDLTIKRSFRFGRGYESQVLDLLNGSRPTADP